MTPIHGLKASLITGALLLSTLSGAQAATINKPGCIATAKARFGKS